MSHTLEKHEHSIGWFSLCDNKMICSLTFHFYRWQEYDYSLTKETSVSNLQSPSGPGFYRSFIWNSDSFVKKWANEVGVGQSSPHWGSREQCFFLSLARALGSARQHLPEELRPLGSPEQVVVGGELPVSGLRFDAENLVSCLILLLFLNLASSHRGYVLTWHKTLSQVIKSGNTHMHVHTGAKCKNPTLGPTQTWPQI